MSGPSDRAPKSCTEATQSKRVTITVDRRRSEDCHGPSVADQDERRAGFHSRDVVAQPAPKGIHRDFIHMLNRIRSGCAGQPLYVRQSVQFTVRRDRWRRSLAGRIEWAVDESTVVPPPRQGTSGSIGYTVHHRRGRHRGRRNQRRTETRPRAACPRSTLGASYKPRASSTVLAYRRSVRAFRQFGRPTGEPRGLSGRRSDRHESPPPARSPPRTVTRAAVR